MRRTETRLDRISDVGVLSLLVGEEEAKRLYRGSLASLLSTRGGACEALAVIEAAREFVRRAIEERLADRTVATDPDAVRQLLKVIFAGKEHEVFAVLFFDAQNGLIATELLFQGTLAQAAVYPRELVKAALAYNAAAVIVAHNHPSGNPEPSRADEHLTQSLRAALGLVDVRVLDHVVMAGGRAVSFAQRGML
jgi:DNA repair protein RadC